MKGARLFPAEWYTFTGGAGYPVTPFDSLFRQNR